MNGRNRDCGSISEALGAHALGSLEPDEAADVAAHLRDCEPCQRELIEIEDALGLVPSALDRSSRLEPPRELRAWVLDDVAQAPAPFAPRRRSLSQRVVYMAAAVVLLALVSTAYMGVALATERAAKNDLAAQISQDEIVLDVVDSTATQKRVLRATSPVAPRAYGKLYTRPDADHAVLMVARMPSPEQGHVYRAWLWRDGIATGLGDVNVNDEGFGRLVFRLESVDVPAIERVMVTSEPASAFVQGDVQPVVSWQR